MERQVRPHHFRQIPKAMASPSTQQPYDDNPISVSARAEVLHSLVEITAVAVNTQLDAFTSRLAAALQDAATARPDTEDASRYASAAQLLKKNRYAFHYVVSERLQMVLQQAIDGLEQNPAATLELDSPKKLAPDLEVDKKLSLLKLGRVLDADLAERLYAVNRRLAHLIGVEALTDAQNPFRSHLFLSLAHDAWCEFCPDAASHHLVYPLLGANLCLDPVSILNAVNAALVKRRVLPTLTQPFRVEVAEAEQEVAEAMPAAEDPLTLELRRLFPVEQHVPQTGKPDGDFPALFESQDVQETAGRNALFSYLGEIQSTQFDRHLAACAGNGPQGSSMLAHVKRQMPQGVLKPADESTIDLLTGIFDAVFQDKHIPDEIKGLMGALQVPILKTALLDKAFFFDVGHPARRTIELMAQLGLDWNRNKGLNDPLYQTFQRNVSRIHESRDQQPAMFAKAVWELESFMTREATAATHSLSAPIAHALQQEKKHDAAKTAKEQVALRVGTGEVVAFVETFLEDKWVAVLTLAYGVKEEKPEYAESALKTMDDLVWSMKPKITAEERKELLAKLPSMIVSLNQWLDLIKWDSPRRARFFTELAKCHASIVRAPLELSPERQMQIALRVAKHAAERRAKKEAERASEPEPDEFDQAVAGLERGVWVEFKQESGLRTKLKLAWVSPMHNFFIFSAKDKQEARSMTAEELAQAVREQDAQIVQLVGMVERAMASVLGTGRTVNEPEAKAAA
jgi:hypothetical protein